MGRSLFRRFKDLTCTASESLGYCVETLCTDNPDGKLSRTEFAQPAIYVTNVLHYLSEREEGLAQPHYLAGHSLGEYCALFAADCYDFDAGLRIVVERGRVMGCGTGGKMAAVLGIRDVLVEKILELGLAPNTTIANYNSPTQVVIAGPEDELVALDKIVKGMGGRTVPLGVAAAFHSKYMVAAADEFSRYIESFAFRCPQISVVSSLTACPYLEDEIASCLTKQIHSPVRWTESVHYMLRQGVSSFFEAGKRGVLTRLVEEIRAEIQFRR